MSNHFIGCNILSTGVCWIWQWLVNLNPEELRKPIEIVVSKGEGETVDMMRRNIIASQEVRVTRTPKRTLPKSRDAGTKHDTCSSTAYPHHRCSIGLSNFTTSLGKTTTTQKHKKDVRPSGSGKRRAVCRSKLPGMSSLEG